jgi:hypothetical protein
MVLTSLQGVMDLATKAAPVDGIGTNFNYGNLAFVLAKIWIALEVQMKIEVDPKIFLTYRARDIQTRTSDGPVCVEIEESPILAFEKLERAGFDQAPVTSDQVEIGYVLTKDLRNAVSVESIFHKLSPEDLISCDSPLNDLLLRLVKQPLIFTVGKDGIEGFVVPSDIGRHVSRAHLYLFISGLEILMTKIIAKENFKDEELIEVMKDDSKKARDRDLRQGLDANAVEYLDILGMGKLMARMKTPLIHLGVKEADWSSFIGRLSSIRNWVAHSNTEQMTKHPFHDIVQHLQLTEEYIKKLNSFS